MTGKKAFIICLIALIPVAVVFTQCFYRQKTDVDARGQNYAGSAACIKCHSDISRSYLHTAHFGTSKIASATNVQGNFSEGFNTFNFAGNQKVVMQKRDSGLYQFGYVNGKQTNAGRYDIAVGGVKAETYLSWRGSELFELPISYFNAIHNWTNSPGYAADKINFDRPIVARCLECHSSYIYQQPQRTLTNTRVMFDKNTLIAGIDCERCHGPAQAHVNFHIENPEQKKARFITSFKSLSRAQKLDACAVCHSGNSDQLITSAFNFKPGDTLANFKQPGLFAAHIDGRKIDVHGNQNGLLAASKCFLMSNMDCTTCHNTHVNERNNMVMYNKRCNTCHNLDNHNICKLTPQLGPAIQNKCVDCHMPAKPSNLIAVQTASEKSATPYLVHTHLIAVYPAEAKKILDYINKAVSLKN
jgi:hypothetical protein